MLRAVVFGQGHMGRLHARKLEARGDVLVEVIDPPMGRPAPGLVEADFAVVATPTRTHIQVALPLLERGIPCLVEKPLAPTSSEARQLARFSILSVGFVERHNPALAPVEDVRPRYLQAERLAPFPAGVTAEERDRSKRAGARGTDADVVFDLMVHDLDLLGIFLPGRVKEVRAVGVGVVGQQSNDVVDARIELDGGVATLTASRVSREPVRKLRLVEPGIYWSVDLLRRTVHRVRWGEGSLDPEPVAVPEGDAIEREHAAFIAAVRGQAPFPSPAADALRTMAIAEAILGQIRRSPAAPDSLDSG